MGKFKEHTRAGSLLAKKESEFVIHAYQTAEERGAILSAIVQSSYDAIISKDLNGIITSWNKAAERIFGYSSSEMIGSSIFILIPEDRLEEEPAILSKISVGDRIENFHTKRKKKGWSAH